MFNLGAMLQRRNIFGPSGTQPTSPYDKVDFRPPPMAPPPVVDNTPAAEGPATANYRKFLDAGAPNREDFKPGKMDRFGAALSGVAAATQGRDAFGTARNQLDEPYNEATKDWAGKEDRLSKGAKLEADTANVGFENKLKVGAQKISQQNADSLEGNRASLADSRDRRLTLQEAIADGRATDAEKQEYQMLQIAAKGKNQIANTKEAGNQARTTEGVKQSGRMAIEAHKTANPNHKYFSVKGGNIMSINPQTNEVEDTGVETNTLSDEDKAQLGLDNAVTLKQTASAGSETETTSTDNAGNKVVTNKITKPVGGAKGDINLKGGKKAPAVVKPKQMKDAEGKVYDTSTWSDADIANAKKNGYK